jgi:hypothetical protein
MAKARTDKVIVTNQAVLKSKYGAGYNAMIKPALEALIAADKARGLSTLLVPLDNARTMAKYKTKPVTKPADARQNKKALDAVYKALTPAYLCILGAVDVVPHQDLVNPISSDGDAVVPSDLPYACDQGYSEQIEDFLMPTRVVGRLPDVTGGGDAAYLAGLLGTAAKAQSLPHTQYKDYLGITAQVWQASTQQSLQNLFGNSTDLQNAPPKGPPWTGLIDRLAHFINCHGAPADPHFYGQQGNNYPVAHDAAQLHGLRTGTVASAECCYGAELYDPDRAGGRAGICNTYLGAGAHGFFGSSTIAYGPASGNAQADLLCQFFLKYVLSGASLGEAALQARLDFIKVLSVADPTDLKTLAQFSLMGEPSLHPVAVAPAGQSVVEGRTTKALALAAVSTDPLEIHAASRPLRRLHLAALGQMLGSAVAAAVTDSKEPATGGIKQLLEAELAKQNAQPQEVVSFALRRPKLAGAKGVAFTAAAAGVDSVQVAVGELPREGAPFKRLYVVVARQQDNQVVLRHLYSR